MARTVAVIGASGRQGGAQVRQLAKAGFAVKALSRSADPFYGEEKPDNVEVVAADLYDEASLTDAFAGADAVFHTHPLRARADRAAIAGNVGRAAKAAGVERVVWNTSSWIPDRPGDPFTYAGNTAGLNALFRTGVGATVFGSVLFMDNLLTNWARPFIVNEGRFVYAHRPDTEANWISLDDVARVMIHSLDRPDMEGAWINIGGPERLRPPQLAAALTDALGREVVYDACTPQEFGRHLANAYGDEMSREEKDAIADQIGQFYDYNINAPTKPFEVDEAEMQRRIPIELETFADWAKRQDWRNTNAPRPRLAEVETLPGEYLWVTLVSGLALLVYYFTLLIAGVARVRFKVPAPSHDGPEDYVRRVRAHQNTLEHLVLFLPGMWLFALTVSPVWAAAIGAIWPPARLAYAMGYHRAAEKRRIGIYVSMPPIYIFVLGTIVASIVRLVP